MTRHIAAIVDEAALMRMSARVGVRRELEDEQLVGDEYAHIEHDRLPSAAVRRTTVAWARADTPRAVYSLMSYGFKVGLRRGQTPAKCAAWITKAIGPFSATSGRIISTSTVDCRSKSWAASAATCASSSSCSSAGR
jgi:hypothetical protein